MASREQDLEILLNQAALALKRLIYTADPETPTDKVTDKNSLALAKGTLGMVAMGMGWDRPGEVLPLVNYGATVDQVREVATRLLPKMGKMGTRIREKIQSEVG